MIPPTEMFIAQAYLKRNVAIGRIPSLIQKELEETEWLDKRNGVSDLYPREEGDGGSLKYVRWMSWPILAEAYAKLKQPEKAREVLAQMSEALKEEEIGRASCREAKRSR